MTGWRPLFGYYPRGTDAHGSGAFGASRDGGKRQHLGTDLAVWPGTPVHAPAEADVVREIICYGDDPLWRGLELRLADTSEGVILVRLLYVAPVTEIVGRRVTSYDVIGAAQDIRKRYPGITPHVHVEVWSGGTRVDPGPYLGVA